ncbi:putative ankyrin repeat protein RF_0381 isoform X1 [Chrysoperla carnea]|uniref:putative ankyrin repeat protein RF_0381 isoform X1 n=1 Tax=Chrysoperla carnea TaxID=189513 RepID=UPI001D072361|nr:putative ankyrin repeat protein RF_0381 isoform X1 [Chrysoperla carnea]
MPTECITNPLQRELADSIIRMVPLDEIRILLACGAKVNEPVTQGLRPLHYAIWQRYVEATQLLLVRGCDINAIDECGYSALHLATEHGYVELVELLLKSGAKVDYRPNTDELYPRTTLCDEPLRLAIRNKNLQIARMLLEYGADPNKRYFFGSEINLVNDIEFLELLLTFGANPDTRDRAGLTPLMKAARQSQFTNGNSKAQQVWTRIFNAQQTDSISSTLLSDTNCTEPYGMEAVLLLISHGADVNAMTDARHDYRTVLHYAVLSGNKDIVNLLIKQGARLNYDSDEYGKPSPLDLAILKGDLDLIRLLIGAGADVNFSSPVIGTPLHVACSDNISNRLEILQLLLKSGADPNLKVYNDIYDHNTQLRPVLVEYLASNETPLFSVVNLLLRYGARVVMKTQFRDPDGCLNCLQNVTKPNTEKVFYALVDASESFDVCMIRRNNIITPEQKSFLMEVAAYPLSLAHQIRLFLRRQLKDKLPDLVSELPLPLCLRKYLIYEYNI